ncbi:hypothetical protein [Yersinia mollaretii]|uniref:hypothetical protein n=1 Tax=Yersinia mollaretii TaxID=33060 RepID=UPI0011A6958C|nr:hypothetical protein [Yersinia mollaretii]
MAIIKAPTLADTVYQGPQGNLSLAEGRITLNDKVKVGDVIELLELPLGICIYGMSVVSHEGVNLNLAIAVSCGDTVLASGIGIYKPTTSFWSIKPYTTKEGGEKLTVTVTTRPSNYVPGQFGVTILYVAVGH